CSTCPPPTEIYPLSLHDALPIFERRQLLDLSLLISTRCGTYRFRTEFRIGYKVFLSTRTSRNSPGDTVETLRLCTRVSEIVKSYAERRLTTQNHVLLAGLFQLP